MSARRCPQHALRNALACLAGMLALTAADGSSLFDGNAGNTWLVDQVSGVTLAAFDVAGAGTDWTTAASADGPSDVVVSFDGGNELIDFVDLSSQMVLVNNLSGSMQNSMTGLNPQLPGISLQGLGLATGNVADPDSPTLTATPHGGNFSATTAVTLRAVPARNNDSGDFVFFVVLNGVGDAAVVTVPNGETAQHTFYLVDGSYTLNAFVQQDGNNSATVNATYIVNAPDSLTGDTDGDGIPDAVEIEWGGNPLTADAMVDSDGDGWSDLDERLRNTDPENAADEPLDSDGDGWPDYDEDVRNTDPLLSGLPLEWTDKPAATRFTEVEYLLSGSVFADAAATTLQLQMAQFEAHDIYWARRYSQPALLDAAGLAAANPPIPSEAVLPERYRKSEVDARLASGLLPVGLRLPAGAPLVLRSRQTDGGGGLLSWSSKAWLDAQPDLSPTAVAQYIADNALSWTEANEWLEHYDAYLRDNAVIAATADLSPVTGLATALIEAAIAWHQPVASEIPVLLGETRAGRSAPGAARELLRSLGESDRGFTALESDFALLISSGELQNFAAAAADLYSGTAPLTAATTTESVADLVQGLSSDPEWRYLTRLMVILSGAELDALPGFDRVRLTSTLIDYDGDGAANATELAPQIAVSTSPLNPDSDGDMLLDADDPCGYDASNDCLLTAANNADTDGDGIRDPVDNCLNDFNPLQIDGNNDGIGDLCAYYANILSPAANVVVLAGDSVEFTSIVTEFGATQALTYTWDFDGGAANSNVPNPGDVAFATPGTYTISLEVFDATLASLGSDQRAITVLNVAIDSDGDGVPDSMDSFPNDNTNSGALIWLIDNQPDTGNYGNGFGTDEHFSKLAIEFAGVADGAWLHVQGFDIDTDGEIEIYVNDQLVGSLSAGVNDGFSADSLWWLDAQSLDPVANRLEFRNTVAGDTWGVTRLGVFTPGSAFGNVAGLGLVHTDGFEIHLADDGSGRLLRFADTSAPGTGQVQLSLGVEPLATAPVPGKVYELVLAADRLQSGDNLLPLTNLVAGQDWSVVLGSVRTLTAELGLFATGATEPDHVDRVDYLMPLDAQARELGIEFYDITAVGELTLDVNGSGAVAVPLTGASTWGALQLVAADGSAPVAVAIDSTVNPPGMNVWGVRIASLSGGVDTDGDGVADATDNCTVLANADQRDTDGDQIGNACDPDVASPNDCFVNFADLNLYKSNFFVQGDVDTDNNGDGFTNFADLNTVQSFFFGPPGPSAAGCN